MRHACIAFALAGAWVCAGADAYAQNGLTLSEALARAREHAPAVVSARLAIDEARARLVGARARAGNPEIGVAIGNRSADAGRSTDLDLGVAQMLDIGARRSARMAMASAGIEQREADVATAVRTALLDTATAFLRVLHVDARIEWLDRSLTLAQETLAIAERRFRAGDIAVLDVNVARAAVARAQADRRRANAEKATRLGDLQSLLQLEAVVDVRGDLVAAAAVSPETAVTTPPEIAAFDAAIREAEAEQQVGRSLARPSYGLEARYQREESSHIVLGGLTIALPIASRGQGESAAGRARAARLRVEQQALRTRIAIEIASANAAYRSLAEAVDAMATGALPGLDDNDTLATRSFEVGQIGLAELLLIRRETFDTRLAYVDALLDAALARAVLDARRGVLR